MELRLLYEHLMCDAFKCSRCDYDFVNADCYTNVLDHVNETAAYIKCAIISLSLTGEISEEIKTECLAMMDSDISADILDDILNRLYNQKVIL